ncbi:putative beta-ketoacyl-[acyl-carrier-protein] synthase I [Helianthus annuus]|nr:putative beta-ketoacyl-[acyl-carrier-protein] synthase I [Helianthus annuus]
MINRFDGSKFPTWFGGQIRGFKANGCIDAKNDRRRDDCLRYCIVAGKKALEDADLAADKRSKGLIELDPVEVKMEYINFKKFDFVEGYSNHPYLKSKSSWWQASLVSTLFSFYLILFLNSQYLMIFSL